jgi:hypothetical protein
MGNIVTKEKAIILAQYLDLVYSHSDTLYYMIPNSSHPSNDPSRPAIEPGFVSDMKTISAPAQISEVNVIQSTSSQQPRGKNKNKVKYKKYSN